jgi:hypothetical protein
LAKSKRCQISRKDNEKEMACKNQVDEESEVSHPLLSWRDWRVKTLDTYEERKAFIDELKRQWKTLWRERIDDEVRAEGISSKDYSELFVERGTVIVATRKYRPPVFYDIVQRHLSSSQSEVSSLLSPSPVTGGWNKFVRTVLNKQQSSMKRRQGWVVETDRKVSQQLKKCGRGWLHFRRG